VTPKDQKQPHVGGFDGQFYLCTKDGLNTAIHLHLRGYERTPRISWLLKYGPQTGVGNYLANEALGRLGLNPFEPCESLAEATDLLLECGKVAEESYISGGNSFAGGYYRLDGKPGGYDSLCKFYRAPAIPRQVFRGRPVYSNYQQRSNGQA
jgi:formamidopyrimidine-DNA glycosylase